MKMGFRAIVTAVIVSNILCSCVILERPDLLEDGTINDEVVAVDCVSEISEGIYNYLETYNNSTAATPAFCYYSDSGSGDWGSGCGWVDSYFGIESYDYTNHVRTLHVEERNLTCIDLGKLHPSIEALDLSGYSFDLSRLGCCPNVRFLKLDCQSAGGALCSIASQFPKLEVLYVRADGEYYPDAEDLQFARKLPNLKVLVYISHSPVKDLEDRVREIFLEGHVLHLVIEAEYANDECKYNNSEVYDNYRQSIVIRSSECSVVDVGELLRSVRCQVLDLQCYGVIPRGLTGGNVNRIALSLEMRRQPKREN